MKRYFCFFIFLLGSAYAANPPQRRNDSVSGSYTITQTSIYRKVWQDGSFESSSGSGSSKSTTEEGNASVGTGGANLGGSTSTTTGGTSDSGSSSTQNYSWELTYSSQPLISGLMAGPAAAQKQSVNAQSGWTMDSYMEGADPSSGVMAGIPASTTSYGSGTKSIVTITTYSYFVQWKESKN